MQGADLLVFSELSICGYPPRDFLEFNDFIEKCHEALHEIKMHTLDIAVLIGCPSINPKKKVRIYTTVLIYYTMVKLKM